MLQEVKDIQDNAVKKLCSLIQTKDEITFRAPTGSGKTYMMADFMNRILSQNSNIIFIVSTLSKSDLAGQNHEKFEEYSNKGIFPNIKSFLINTETSGEEDVFIPSPKNDYNVYVLPRDLYKEKGLLKQGAMRNFLEEVTNELSGLGMTIYLIKDECHQATKNLDEISGSYFSKIINFSATPKLSRGQYPDVCITDEEAENALLIKRITWGNETDTLEDAIQKFEAIKGEYRALIVNPCLIIQISNKDKAEDEWNNTIKPVLDNHQGLKWMLIVDSANKGFKNLCDTNDDVRKRLPVTRWKNFAKENTALIDVIIFKMVISEGWDIPRACMLYQVRDTQSKQLDEQVIGRVRRNPRLLDFETLSKPLQELATTSWIWGVKPNSGKKHHEVKLASSNTELSDAIKLKTIRIKNLTEKNDFSVADFISQQKKPIISHGIFDLYRKLNKCHNEISEMCYDYANDETDRWFDFVEHIDEVKKKYEEFVCDYDKCMEVNDEEVSFPANSSYVESDKNVDLESWIWQRKDGNSEFSFDSDAEKEWAEQLQLISNFGCVNKITLNDTLEKFLWGKNFLPKSEIRYEYYRDGIHSSYPDFIMKDSRGGIHIFEVKSVNKSSNTNIDQQEYEDKIRELEKCYIHCSKLLDYYFYLPIKNGSKWQIQRYYKGEREILTKENFFGTLK